MKIVSFIASMTLKAKIIAATVVTLVVAGGVAAGVVLLSEDAYRVVKIFDIDGSADVSRNEWDILDAYIGMNLEGGDLLSVAPKSTVNLSLDSDKYIMLEENTKLAIVAEGTAENSKTYLELVSGAILNEITKPLAPGAVYEVNTPKSTMAIRGTSFFVDVKKHEDGSYITTLTTIHGVVEVQLKDENENKKGEPVLVPEDKEVVIITEPNENTNNDATIDGNSFFAIKDAEQPGTYIPCGEEESPVMPADYTNISDKLISEALESDSTERLVLNDEVESKLRGLGVIEPSETEHTEQETTEKEITEQEVTEPAVTTVPEENEPAVTTVPVTEDTELSETSVKTATETEVTTDFPEDEMISDDDDDDSALQTTVSEPVITTVPEEETTPEAPSFSVNTSVVPPMYPPTVDTSPVTEVTTISKPNIYTVTFINGDEIVSVIAVESNGKILNIPAIPEKEGYTGKWMYNGTEFTTDTVVTGDMTATAEYTPIIYTVTFTNEGETVDTISADYGTTVETLPTLPEKEGYTCKWIYNGTEFTTATVVTGDMTVTAEYTINTYTVTLEFPYYCCFGNINSFEGLVDGDKTATTKIEHGDSVLFPEVYIYPRANEYNFTSVDYRWVPDYDPENPIYKIDTWVESEEITKDTVFTLAIDNLVPVTIRCVGDTTKCTLESDYKWDTTYHMLIGTELTLPTVTYADENTIGVWTSGGEEISDGYTISAETELTLTISEFCNVTYVDKNGNQISTEKVIKGETASALPTLESDYIWAYNGKEFTTSTTITEDITVTAVIPYTVTFYPYYVYNPEYDYNVFYEVVPNSAFPYDLPEIPELEGRTPEKWVYYVDENEYEFTKGMTITSDMEVYPAYTLNTYTVTFVDESGATVDTISVDYETTLSELPTVPEKTGYTGKWMYTLPTGTQTEFTTDCIIYGNTTVTAEYTPIPYTVTLDETSGSYEYTLTYDKSFSGTSSIDYGTAIVLPSVNMNLINDTASNICVWSITTASGTVEAAPGSSYTVTEDAELTLKFKVTDFIAVTFIDGSDDLEVVGYEEDTKYYISGGSYELTLPQVEVVTTTASYTIYGWADMGMIYEMGTTCTVTTDTEFKLNYEALGSLSVAI